MTLLFGLAIRSSIVLAIGLVMTLLLRRQSAALRHRVLAIALLAAVLVGPFSLAVPEWRVTLPAGGLLQREVALPLEPATAPLEAEDSRAVTSPPAYQASATAEVPWPFLIVTVWVAGVVIVAGTLATGLMRIRRMTAGGRRIDDANWLEILARITAGYGLSRSVILTRTASADLLATCGFRRPHVLLPHHSRDWTDDRVQVVLAHELAHIRRNDWLVQMGAEAVRALLWFNPLVWIACRRLRRESEQACDDEVLNAGVGGREYAGHLLELVRHCRASGSSWAPALPMAHPSTLERRIAAMLNPQLDRRLPSRRALFVLGAVLLLVMVPLASVRARQAGPGPFSGTVYDVSGGVLPGVNVALVDANEIVTTALTNASGRFEFPLVAPGGYNLEAKLPGFRALRQHVEFSDAGDWDRVITLQVGDLQESITVRVTRQLSGAAAGADAPQQVRVGGSIRVPMKIKDVRPSYPPSMVAAGLGGRVPLEAVIGQDGTVSTVRVLTAQIHPDLANAAMDAVRQWRFTPTLLNGKPVDVVMTVSVTFDIDG